MDNGVYYICTRCHRIKVYYHIPVSPTLCSLVTHLLDFHVVSMEYGSTYCTDRVNVGSHKRGSLSVKLFDCQRCCLTSMSLSEEARLANVGKAMALMSDPYSDLPLPLIYLCGHCRWTSALTQTAQLKRSTGAPFTWCEGAPSVQPQV